MTQVHLSFVCLIHHLFYSLTRHVIIKGFVMLDHPDFCSVRELEKAKATMPLQLLRDRTDDEEDDEEEADGVNNEKKKQQADASTVATDTAAVSAFNPADQRRSLTSIRAGVTCAMVAVALGFTCCKSF